MTRPALFAAVAFSLFAPRADAQLVPLSQCGSAIPCSIPEGLRPPDAAALSPYARAGAGNALVSFSAGIEDSLRLSLFSRMPAEDPAERAARIFLKRNPTLFRAPASTPTPTPIPTR